MICWSCEFDGRLPARRAASEERSVAIAIAGEGASGGDAVSRGARSESSIECCGGRSARRENDALFCVHDSSLKLERRAVECGRAVRRAGSSNEEQGGETREIKKDVEHEFQQVDKRERKSAYERERSSQRSTLRVLCSCPKGNRSTIDKISEPVYRRPSLLPLSAHPTSISIMEPHIQSR